MIIRGYNGKDPRLGARVFVAENAAIIGDVEIGDDCSIWYSATIRGDVNGIRIGARTNVQDNCTIHVTHLQWPTVIAEEVTIGHGAIVHGCTVHRGALIGMGSRVLDGAVIGEFALIGAGALVPRGDAGTAAGARRGSAGAGETAAHRRGTGPARPVLEKLS